MGGRKSIEPNLAKSLHGQNHLLEDYFSAKKVKMEETKKKTDENDNDEDESDGTDNGSNFVEKVGVGSIFIFKLIFSLNSQHS